jgi:hypothetical protein
MILIFGLNSHFTYLVNSPTKSNLWRKVFFFIFNQFFPLISKLATVARGHPKTIRTQSLIRKLVFGGFSKKIRNKTIYFYTKKKLLHYYFKLSFGPRVHFQGQKLTLCRNKKVFYTECPLVKLSYFTLGKSIFFHV